MVIVLGKLSSFLIVKYCPFVNSLAPASLSSMLVEDDTPIIVSFTDAVAFAVIALRLYDMPASPQLVAPEPSDFKTDPDVPFEVGKQKLHYQNSLRVQVLLMKLCERYLLHNTCRFAQESHYQFASQSVRQK